MLINIHDIVNGDTTSIKDLWIVLKKETAGPTPAVSYVSIPKDTLEYELSDDIVSDHFDVQLKVWFVVGGQNRIKFFNLKSSSKINTEISSDLIPLIRYNNTSTISKIINKFKPKVDPKQQLSDILSKANKTNLINDSVIGTKNLIYYSVYQNPDYLEMLNLSILSLLKHNSSDKFDILIITDKKTKAKINELSFVSKKSPLYHITKSPKDGVEASINKIKIFDFNKINDYQNILYLDCDTVSKSNIDGIFDNIKYNVLYTTHSLKTKLTELFKTMVYGFESVDDEFVKQTLKSEQYPFNAGQFLFKNSTRMREHFKNLNYFVSTWRGKYFFEQGYMNYYFCGAGITESNHLGEYVKICNLTEDPSISESKAILHFAGTPLKGWEKLHRIYKFSDRDIFEYILSLKTIPEKTIQESGGKWTITETNKVLDFGKFDIHGDHVMENRPWIPDIGLLELKNGTINGNLYPCVLDKKELYPILGLTIYGGKDFRNKVAEEANWMLDRQKLYFKNLKDHKAFYKKDGRGLMLCSTWAIHNYCHFLLDTFSRLDVLKSLNLNLNDYDWVCLPQSKFKIFDKIVEKLNIDKEKIIYLNNTDFVCYQFDTLDVPSLNGRIQIYSENAFKEIRRLLEVEDHITNCNRRVYLKRPNGRRSFDNLEEVEKLLSSYDFEFIEAENEEDIVSIMNQSKIVVSAHGAGLSNLLFCSKQSTAIELMPEFWQKQYYMSLANSIGMNYACIMCKDSSDEAFPSKQILCEDTLNRSMIVDVEVLQKYIEKYL